MTALLKCHSKRVNTAATSEVFRVVKVIRFLGAHNFEGGDIIACRKARYCIHSKDWQSDCFLFFDSLTFCKR